MIAAMVSVASERGSANATVGRVVARSGVSRRTFYEIFEGSEDCFLAALQESIAAASRHVLDAYDPPAPWRVRIRAALTALLEFFDEEPDMARMMIVEALGAGPRALECRSHALHPLIAAVDAGGGEAKKGSSDGGLSPLMAEGVVGAVLSVLHGRLTEPGRGGASSSRTQGAWRATHASDRGRRDAPPILALASPLMSMIVLPYLGPAASRRELAQPPPKRRATTRPPGGGDPLQDISMRVTHRTICVLSAIAAQPGASNRQIGDAAGVADQGQISKLLHRLERCGLLSNGGAGYAKGAPNAWTLTPKGEQVERAMSNPTASGRWYRAARNGG